MGATHTKTTQQHYPRSRPIAAGVELAFTLEDVLDGTTALQPIGRWTPTTDEATTKTYESSAYGAAVMLFSDGFTKGWQVEVREDGDLLKDGDVRQLFDEPVSREKAFREAREEMNEIALGKDHFK